MRQHIIKIIGILMTATFAYSQSASLGFIIQGGATSWITVGASATPATGYARTIHANFAMPMGMAIFSLRQNNTLVSEATVPLTPTFYNGRIAAEISATVNTGIAIVNPSNQFASVSYTLTNDLGRSVASGTLMLQPGEQIARFLNQAPFNGPPMFGTFRFSSNRQIAAIALRGLTNERGEFLMTTLPVLSDFDPDFSNRVAHFVSGEGWTTQIIIMNTVGAAVSGTATFIDQAGQPVAIATEAGTSTTFSYSIPTNSAVRLRTSASGALRVGSVRLLGSSTLAAVLIFSYRPAGVTVSEASVPPSARDSVWQLFVESGDSLDTGLAIANEQTSPVRVFLSLRDMDGQVTNFRGSIDIPAGGQISRFLTQIPGFETLPRPFQGVLVVSAPSTFVTMIGLRGRYNERNDFLVTTIPAVSDRWAASTFRRPRLYSGFLFPHFADGGGYTTQFILFRGESSERTAGILDFFTNAGIPFPISVR